ncbi:MAG: radical SAM protein [Bacteroidales bacterium]|nr:radical SAM protein [Bacteroidales bacterium]
MARRYRINEIFFSLQGEGFHAGKPAVFVRFSGCNLACPFCDTDFSVSREMTAEEIAQEVAGCGEPRIIVLTGGEPALQVDESLLEALKKRVPVPIHIETNGTRLLPAGIDWVTCSPKQGSEVVLKQADEVKVVFTETASDADSDSDFDAGSGDWTAAERLVEPWRDIITATHYFLQPCSCANETLVVKYILAHPWWRLSLQMHKYIGIR